MNKYLTTYNLDKDIVEAFSIDDDYLQAIEEAQEWVWQFAHSKQQAVDQHFEKHDEWARKQSEL